MHGFRWDAKLCHKANPGLPSCLAGLLFANNLRQTCIKKIQPTTPNLPTWWEKTKVAVQALGSTDDARNAHAVANKILP